MSHLDKAKPCIVSKDLQWSRSRLFRSRSCEAGQGLAEYLIIVILIAIIVIIGLRVFGGSVAGRFYNATDEITGLGAEGESKQGGDNAGGKENSKADASKGGSEKKDEGSGGLQGTVRSERAGDGQNNNDKVIDSIELDWKVLATIGFIACVFAGAFVYRSMKDDGDKKKKKVKKKKRWSILSSNKKKGDSGQAMAEFVLVSITFLFVILGIVQLAMVFNAYALVRYAAYNAARAAIVHEGNTAKMQEAARISLLPVFPRHGRADHLAGYVENYRGAVATDSNPSFHQYQFIYRGNTINVSTPITEVKILPGQGRTSGEVVTFDDPQDAEKGIITVEVTHHYEMVIPLVNRILFYLYNVFHYSRTGQLSGWTNETLDYLSAETNKLRRGATNYATVEYRLPLVAHYTMRLQSDYVVP